jgi:hypothetical protein
MIKKHKKKNIKLSKLRLSPFYFEVIARERGKRKA